jgi:hypothetical protein
MSTIIPDSEWGGYASFLGGSLLSLLAIFLDLFGYMERIKVHEL